MNRSIHLFAALLAFTALADAQVFHYYTEMDGNQDQTTEPGTGSGTFVIDTVANTCSFYIEHSGMMNNENAAHIHGPAVPFETADIARYLPVGSPKIGVWHYDESIEADLLAGLYYVNIHSHQVLTGEMRGQIVPTPIRYCGCTVNAPCNNLDANGGCANSSGSGARVEHSGLASVILDTFSPRAENVPPNQFGLFYIGQNAVNLPFGDGRRCVGGTTRRLTLSMASGAGVLTQPPGIVAGANGSIAAGDTRRLQAWYRDPQGPCGSTFNLSDAIAVTFTP